MLCYVVVLCLLYVCVFVLGVYVFMCVVCCCVVFVCVVCVMCGVACLPCMLYVFVIRQYQVAAAVCNNLESTLCLAAYIDCSCFHLSYKLAIVVVVAAASHCSSVVAAMSWIYNGEEYGDPIMHGWMYKQGCCIWGCHLFQYIVG